LAQESYSGFDMKVRELAFSCRDEVTAELNKLISTNKLTLAQIFDTFYIPIPNTNPQKYRTQYDKFTDETIRIVLDKYLEKDNRIKFVVAVDKNGYLPTHNTRYSRPLTGDGDYDTKHNRTKRMFNDRTGLAAARNTKPFLLQSYSRDTGETMMDLSVPIYIDGRHWGAIRIGYQQ
jgi:methyl-accepting chemotaxis protein